MKHNYFIQKMMPWAIWAALSLPATAFAGVVVPATATPLATPAAKAPAAKTTTTAQPTVPAIQSGPNDLGAYGDNAAPNGVKQESSAQIWQQTIQAPPSARIQNRTLAGIQKALIAGYQAGRYQSLPPIASTNGEILYAFGHSLPTLVTSPMHTSIIMLQPGSHPATATGASPAVWHIQAVMAGNMPEVLVTPYHEGLHTDLVIPATSASGKPMNYVIELTSDASKYTPILGFYYPGQDEVTWKNQADSAAAAKQKVADETVAAMPNLTASDLDFNYKVRCSGGGWFSNSDCGSIMPERVFSDNGHTYIQFGPKQAEHGGIPAILGENSAGQNAIINSQYRDGYYIVDSEPAKILLLAGKGSNGKVVKITRENRN